MGSERAHQLEGGLRRTRDLSLACGAGGVRRDLRPHFSAIRNYLARRVDRKSADDLASQTFTVAFGRRATFPADVSDARP
ncbi:MAG: hypothetical protein JO342_08635 [Solirubrobacterales bacterium]|nr:hypothetical protein [Solirubrobacterales bacterium]